MEIASLSNDVGAMISFNSNVWLDNHHKVAYSINSLGLPSAYGYYPFGTTVELAEDVNYIDPTGVWALGAAMQLGNNNEFGFNASYSWNQDGSNSLNVSRISLGYEWGLMGMEGRGAYAGASVFGLYASVSQNGGYSKFSMLGGLYSSEKMLLAVNGYYGDDPKLKIWAKYLHEMNSEEYSFIGHYDEATGGFIFSPNSDDGWNEPAVIATELLQGGYIYKEEKAVRFYSCNLAKDMGAETISSMMQNKTIIAATGRVVIQPVYFLWKLIHMRTRVIDGGKWVSYKNGVKQ